MSMIANLLLNAADERRALNLPVTPAIDAAQAEKISEFIRSSRRARGEEPRGYKIGFTNRSIWPLYGVDRPIWGVIYNTTIEQLADDACAIRADQFVEPRLEPEIVLGLKTTPQSAALSDLVAAIDWYAHGYEIVQSIYPNWKFSAPEAFAAQGLHAALKIGSRRPLSRLHDPVRDLAGLRVSLFESDMPVAQGVGANVLDGPIQALAHLVRELELRHEFLRPGDIVTTGTLTDAMPLQPGQCWTSRFAQGELPDTAPDGIRLTVS